MIKLIVGANVFNGVLKNYEMEGTDLVLRLEFRADKTINVVLPSFPKGMLDSMKRMGLDKLKNSTIDMNTGTISLSDTLKEVPGRMKGVSENRPTMKTIRGGMVG